VIARARTTEGESNAARHVAIIMDGNRRWARERRLPTIEGHRAGTQTLRQIIRAASRLGVEILTVFAFSEENWRREPSEVALLMELLRLFALSERDALCAENVRIGLLGRIDALPQSTRDALNALVDTTASNDGLLLNLAINYGARRELGDAMRALARDVQRGNLAPSAIDEETLSHYLYTAGLPDPDLLIRTGGELRLSNFLLYQVAYTELWATPVYWPDFDASMLAKAIGSFSTRQRRFGT
jgi:undecaprenyl diphosphate synthase